MTLRRRFLVHNLLLVCGLFAAGGVSVWRLGVLRGDVDLSRNVYAELRTVGNVAVDVGMVRGLLTSPQANRDQIVTHLNYAIGGLDQFIEVGRGYGGGTDATMREAYVPINRAAGSARGKLNGVLHQVSATASPADVPAQGTSADAQLRAVDSALSDIDQVASTCITFMKTHQETASAHLRTNLLLVGLLSLAAVGAAVLLSFVQDRLVMLPLQRLREGVRRIAAAKFTEKLDPSGMASCPEFADLAAEFNHMSGELDDFYKRLEEKVRAQSRELVKSERLASVGFLAAGVAHEINNPLNIISGYAELTVRQLNGDGTPIGDQAADQTRQSLRIIRDEAFRCKEITEKLLSLARSRGGDDSDARETLDLSGVARDVAAMTKGLKNYRDRTVTVKLDPSQPLEVQANLTEMKQVLLNLTINALEAVPPVKGEVSIEGRRTRDWVELSVADNGRGMGPEVLSHVFEPFFTSRRGSDPSRPERGTGLGLSITHAIVESHGGKLEAESDGPGRGARFTVRLPARRSA